MSRQHQFLATISLACLMGVAPALAGGQTPAGAAPPGPGQFPIEDHIAVLEPESTVCGFPVRIDLTGTLSANGIELRFSSSDNKFYDFGTNTLAEVGLVFRYAGPAVGVVLMDRGRLIWNIDNTGEMVGPPRFEAGPHPELHGDFGGLCAALTH